MNTHERTIAMLTPIVERLFLGILVVTVVLLAFIVLRGWWLRRKAEQAQRIKGRRS